MTLLIRIAVFSLPIAASIAAGLTLRWQLPSPNGVYQTVAWVIAIALPSTLVLKLVEALARRLLPLAALLNMSLLFPDEAPSRMALARRSGRVRDLRLALADMKAAGEDHQNTRAADTIFSLAASLAAHDRITRGHSERVRVFADLIAAEMKLNSADSDRLRWAALLHDIGKLMVPFEILNKTGRLDPWEKDILNLHPVEGKKLIAPIAAWLGPWGDAVLEHHERMDGQGYPYKIPGSDICLGARIVSVADTFECITASRSYKKPMTTADARRELARVSGTQLDPQVVRAFLNISIAKLWRGVGLLSLLAAIPRIPRPVFSGLAKFGQTLAGSATAVGAAAVIFAIGGSATSPVLPSISDTSPLAASIVTSRGLDWMGKSFAAEPDGGVADQGAATAPQVDGQGPGVSPSAGSNSKTANSESQSIFDPSVSSDFLSSDQETATYGDCVARIARAAESSQVGAFTSEAAMPEGAC